MNKASAFFPINLKFDTRKGDATTGKPLPAVPDKPLRQVRDIFLKSRTRWENSETRERLLETLQGLKEIEVNNVVGFSCGSFGAGCPCCHAREMNDNSSDHGSVVEESASYHDSDEEDHSPEGSEIEKKEKDDEGLEEDDDSSSYDSDDEDDEDRRRDDWERSATQHVLLLELRNFFNGRKMKSGGGAKVADVKCSAQDPLYTEVDRKVLEKEGVAVVDDPEGFLKVDEKTAVVCVYPNVPIRQIIADIARPAVIIWDRVEELEPQKKPVRW